MLRRFILCIILHVLQKLSLAVQRTAPKVVTEKNIRQAASLAHNFTYAKVQNLKKINQSNACSVPLKRPTLMNCDQIPSVAGVRYANFLNEADASSSIHFFWNSADDQDFGKINHWLLDECVITSGGAWVPGDPGYPDAWPGFFSFSQRSAHQELPADNSWVEVIHFQRRELDHLDAKDTARKGQFWYYFAPGSGIWLKLGRTWRLDTAGIQTPGCDEAVSQDYDMIMLYPNSHDLPDTQTLYGGAIEIVDCMGTRNHPASARDTWEYTCPPEHASQLFHGNFRNECSCTNALTYLNCCA